MRRISNRITLIVICCTCVSVLLTYASMSSWWQGIICQVTDEASGGLCTMTSVVIMLTVCILLSVLVARKLGNMIAKPIQTMVDATHRIGGGDLNVFVELDTNDEMQELAEAFNEMVSNMSILLLPPCAAGGG